MRVEILPALVRVDPNDCIECALIFYQAHRLGYPDADRTMWLWLFLAVGAPA